jgi:hypothetical protein
MRLVLAIAAPYLLAALCFPLLTRRGWPGKLALIALCLPIALSPCLIPGDKPLPRFLAAVTAVVAAVKLFDIRHEVQRGTRLSWYVFMAFLLNPFVHVRRCLPTEPRPSVRTDLLGIVGGALGLVAGLVFLRVLFRVDWDGCPFLAEHGSKIVAFFLAVLSGLTFAAASWRLLGGMARDYITNPLAARTPADFWRRYNRNMHQFFLKDIFVSAGGLRSPVRATLLVFGISALMHEYLFGIAIGRVQGYQTAFFLLQGLAVAATARVRARGWKAVPWVAGTLGFNLVSSVLFFASLNGLVPFYSHGLPAWLEGW